MKKSSILSNGIIKKRNNKTEINDYSLDPSEINTSLLTRKNSNNLEKNELFPSPVKRLREFENKITPNRLKKRHGVIFSITKNETIFKEKKNQIINYLKKKESEKILQVLLENLWISIDNEDFELMLQTIYLLGDLFLCIGEIANALFSYYHLKILGEMIGNLKYKILGYLALASSFKLLKNYESSIKVLKKALEYCWIIKEEEKESSIYDKIGINYFLLGDLKKSYFYHEKSLNYDLEQVTSPIRVFSINSLKKFDSNSSRKSKTRYTTMNKFLLNRAGIRIFFKIKEKKLGNTDQNDYMDDEIYSIPKDEIPIKISFGTTLNEEEMMEKIFADKDFLYDIPSPRSKIIKLTLNLIEKLGYFEEIVNSKKKLKNTLQNINSIPAKLPYIVNKNSGLKKNYLIDIDPFLLKRSTDELIKQRNNNINSNYNKGSKILDSNEMKTYKKLYYNNLTPNRNMEGFLFYNKINKNKLSKYYDKLIYDSKNYDNNKFNNYKNTTLINETE